MFGVVSFVVGGIIVVLLIVRPNFVYRLLVLAMMHYMVVETEFPCNVVVAGPFVVREELEERLRDD